MLFYDGITFGLELAWPWPFGPGPIGLALALGLKYFFGFWPGPWPLALGLARALARNIYWIWPGQAPGPIAFFPSKKLRSFLPIQIKAV